MNYPLLALLLLAGLSLRAQDTVYVYAGLENSPQKLVKEKAAFYLISVQPDTPFRGLVSFYDKTSHQLYAQVPYNEKGKRHGVVTYFDKGGEKVSEWTYAQGEMDGPYASWYNNGQQQKQGLAKPLVHQSMNSKGESTRYTTTDYLIHQYWDSLGNHLVVNGEGEYRSYHKGGALYERGYYVAGIKDGEWVGYYADSNPHYEEVFREGKLLSGVSFKGNDRFTYTELEEEAQPLDGMAAFYQLLSKNIKYPKKAVKARVQGTVYVRFVIDESGTIVSAESVEGREVGYGIDEEAIRVIYLTKWSPGKQRGITVKQRKILPIIFKLQK